MTTHSIPPHWHRRIAATCDPDDHDRGVALVSSLVARVGYDEVEGLLADAWLRGRSLESLAAERGLIDSEVGLDTVELESDETVQIEAEGTLGSVTVD